MTISLHRRLVAETVGSAGLVAVVVGSGIAAQQLSPDDIGLQLLQNSTATALGLGVLILVLGPVSGAHFNPLISAADWLRGRRDRAGLAGREVLAYSSCQILGAIVGAVVANIMFDDAAVSFSERARVTTGHLVAEIVATAGLVLVVFTVARRGNGAVTAMAVGAYIGSAYWFTSSTSFANPAVTIGRVFTDSFAGIAPISALVFCLAQMVGAAAGLILLRVLWPLPEIPTLTASLTLKDHS